MNVKIISRFMTTVLLLILANVFMTFAWYGHLKFKTAPLHLVILISWGIALIEYCFQIPANRIGINQFSIVQLKTIQEIITLVVFCVFSYFYFETKFGVNQLVGFSFLVLAAYFIFKPS
jgi:uncharacterized protein (DUF486 family)